MEIRGAGDIVDLNGSSHGCTLEQFQVNDDACTRNTVNGAYDVDYVGVPREGWRFSHWEGPCGAGNGSTSCRIQLPEEIVRAYWGSKIEPTVAVFGKHYLLESWFDSGVGGTANQRDINLYRNNVLVAGGSTIVVLDDNLNPTIEIRHNDPAFGETHRDIWLGVHSVVQRGDVLYVAKREGGGSTPKLGNVASIDISDPNSPFLTQELQFPEAPSDLLIRGNELTVAVRKGGVARIRITNSQGMRIMDRAHDDGAYDLYEIMSHHRLNDLVCGPNYYDGMVLFDLSTPGRIIEIPGSRLGPNSGTYGFNATLAYWDCFIHPSGNYVFFTGAPANSTSKVPRTVLDVVDISNPAMPSYGTGISFDVATLEDYPSGPIADRAPQQMEYLELGLKQFLVIANGDIGIELIDVTNPVSPVHEATLHIPGVYLYGVAIDNQFLYAGIYKRTNNPWGGGVLKYDLQLILSDALTASHSKIALENK